MNLLWVLSLSVILASGYGERILFLGLGSKSHKIGYMPIAKALADRGHLVTVVNAFPGLQSSDNVGEIIVKDLTPEFNMDWFRMQQQSPLARIRLIVDTLSTAMKKGYDLVMESEEFLQIVRNRDVDLVVLLPTTDVALPIIDSLAVPFVFYSPQTANSMMVDSMELPKEYASVPSALLSYATPLTFFQRVVNVLTSEFFMIMGRLIIDATIDEYVKKDLPNARSVTEIKRDASLCLMNHHLTTAYPRPLPPNVIPVGALHVRPAEPLPADLQKLADESTDGFIVFTLGSIISGSSLPEHLLQVFVNVFAKFPQRFIWKKDKSAILFPPNVVLLDWIPQQDLIAHPNCRLLISHGGLMSIQEAIYHAVPFLGLPFGTDQHSNLARASKEGYALKLDWDQLNEENLFDAITSLISEPNFRSNATRMSNLMRDEILPGTDVAVYWIEHVLHHGTKHLQLASKKLNLFQKHLIDVWFFLVSILVLSTIFLWLMFNCMCRRLRTPIKQKTQ